jgi:hypothetical protein
MNTIEQAKMLHGKEKSTQFFKPVSFRASSQAGVGIPFVFPGQWILRGHLMGIATSHRIAMLLAMTW